SPRLIAAIAGFTTLLPAACRICAPRTDGKIGHSAITSALALIAIIASARPRRLRREAVIGGSGGSVRFGTGGGLSSPVRRGLEWTVSPGAGALDRVTSPVL